MAAHLARIRISGFKSFADPVALDVLPGLTGLVGPNGCGKSNLAEALRWAMGEASAGTLRGDAMDGLAWFKTGGLWVTLKVVRAAPTKGFHVSRVTRI
jgi:chromosome segregation protein